MAENSFINALIAAEMVGNTSGGGGGTGDVTKAYVDARDATKVDKVEGKGLSTEDYTTEEKTKLSGIAAGAEVNVQSDWSQSDDTADDYIKNKPDIPSVTNKADKVANAVDGNFAGLDSNGNLTDSGKSAADFATASDMSAVQEVIPSTATTSNKLATMADVSGGGSTVSVTQVKSSGEKIATITVDGTGTDIYANTKDVVEYTRAAYNAAKQAGTVPNGVMVAITDEQGMDPTSYYTKTQTDSAISTAVSGKQNAITQSSTLTLTVAGWDTTTLQQTVTFAHDTAKRNEIDITISELKTWADCGVIPVSETATGITFQCDTIPENALTFKVTSMEVS